MASTEKKTSRIATTSHVVKTVFEELDAVAASAEAVAAGVPELEIVAADATVARIDEIRGGGTLLTIDTTTVGSIEGVKIWIEVVGIEDGGIEDVGCAIDAIGMAVGLVVGLAVMTIVMTMGMIEVEVGSIEVTVSTTDVEDAAIGGAVLDVDMAVDCWVTERCVVTRMGCVVFLLVMDGKLTLLKKGLPFWNNANRLLIGWNSGWNSYSIN